MQSDLIDRPPLPALDDQKLRDLFADLAEQSLAERDFPPGPWLQEREETLRAVTIPNLRRGIVTEEDRSLLEMRVCGMTVNFLGVLNF